MQFTYDEGVKFANDFLQLQANRGRIAAVVAAAGDARGRR